MPNPPVSLTGMPLLRCEHLRKNPNWISEQQASENTRFIIIQQGKALLAEEGLARLTVKQVNMLMPDIKHAIFLGLTPEDSAAYFAIDFSHIDDTLLETFCANLSNDSVGYHWQHLRFAINQLTMQQSAICGFAQALINWHTSHHYCGFCGSELKTLEGGHAKKCVNDECAKWVFPRTDPVVIMLVEHTDMHGVKRCLLAGHQRTGGQVVSTLAGFVDPGESIEEAAIREVYEESGLTVDSLNYITSQPWPFPSSLMLGFYMKVSNNQLTIDHNELTHAMWCTKEEIAQFDDWGAKGEGTQIPGRHSIARHLIDKWCAGLL